MTERSRRDVLETAMALAAASAALPLIGRGDAMAQAEGAMSAAEIVALVRDKRITATAIVQAALDRAEKVKHLNAMIVVDRDGALAAARRIDAMRDAGETLPPLAGVPIVVKDNINTATLPTTGGTPALRNARPRANAPSLQKLLDAGAIMIGKANLHELAFGITSTNLAPFAKPVRNPYDQSRMPGGSSGGTAVAIAAGIVPCGLGSDTGGSTRIPPALTGTAGLRPSVGNGGSERRYHDPNAVVPISRTRDTVGPMGRTVADVALLDAVIAGTPIAAAENLQAKRFGVPKALWQGLDTDIAPVLAAAAEKLTKAGIALVDVDMPDLFALNAKVSFPLALHEPREDIPAYLAASGIEGVTLADIERQIASPDVKGAFGAILADAFGKDYPEAMRVHRPALQKMYADYIAGNQLDAILFPTTITPAAPIDEGRGSGEVSINGKVEPTFNAFIRNTDPGSNAGIPGLSLFAGMTASGLPVGIEIDGPIGSDRRLIALGLSMEQVLGTAPAPRL